MRPSGSSSLFHGVIQISGDSAFDHHLQRQSPLPGRLIGRGRHFAVGKTQSQTRAGPDTSGAGQRMAGGIGYDCIAALQHREWRHGLESCRAALQSRTRFAQGGSQRCIGQTPKRTSCAVVDGGNGMSQAGHQLLSAQA